MYRSFTIVSYGRKCCIQKESPAVHNVPLSQKFFFVVYVSAVATLYTEPVVIQISFSTIFHMSCAVSLEP